MQKQQYKSEKKNPTYIPIYIHIYIYTHTHTQFLLSGSYKIH
jgi:hypothetical protein